MGCDISAFTIGDHEEVVALWHSCEGIGLSGADSRRSIRAYLRRNRGRSFVARANGEVVGAVLCGHDGRRGYIHHLAVRPAWPRRGLGRRMDAPHGHPRRLQGDNSPNGLSTPPTSGAENGQA